MDRIANLIDKSVNIPFLSFSRTGTSLAVSIHDAFRVNPMLSLYLPYRILFFLHLRKLNILNILSITLYSTSILFDVE